MKINRRIYSWVDLCVRTLADERKGKCMCMLCQKVRNKLNRYTDERIYLLTCTAVETLTGRSYRLIR